MLQGGFAEEMSAESRVGGDDATKTDKDVIVKTFLIAGAMRDEGENAIGQQQDVGSFAALEFEEALRRGGQVRLDNRRDPGEIEPAQGGTGSVGIFHGVNCFSYVLAAAAGGFSRGLAFGNRLKAAAKFEVVGLHK
jgi:hypothetical protein